MYSHVEPHNQWFMQSLNQHGQGLRDKRSTQIMEKDYYELLLTLGQKEFDFLFISKHMYCYKCKLQKLKEKRKKKCPQVLKWV